MTGRARHFHPEAWQSYDCTRSMIDFDLHDEQRVFAGEAFWCSGCGELEAATDSLVTTHTPTGEESPDDFLYSGPPPWPWAAP